MERRDDVAVEQSRAEGGLARRRDDHHAVDVGGDDALPASTPGPRVVSREDTAAGKHGDDLRLAGAVGDLHLVADRIWIDGTSSGTRIVMGGRLPAYVPTVSLGAPSRSSPV